MRIPYKFAHNVLLWGLTVLESTCASRIRALFGVQEQNHVHAETERDPTRTDPARALHQRGRVFAFELQASATSISHTDVATACSKAELWLRVGVEKEQIQFRAEGEHNPTRTDPARALLQRGLDCAPDFASRLLLFTLVANPT